MDFIGYISEKNLLNIKLAPEISIDQPINEWVWQMGRPLPVRLTIGNASEYTAVYGQEQVRVEIRFEHDPALKVVIQKIDFEFLQDVPDLLLDIRTRPHIDGMLDWLTMPGLFYGDNNLKSDRVGYPKDMKLDWSFRADASPCPGLHFPGQTAGYAAFLAKDRVELAREKQSRPEAKDILGVGWVNREDCREFRLTYPCQEIPRAYHRPDRLERGLKPTLAAQAGWRLSLEIFHFVTEGGRQGYFGPVRYLYEHNRPAEMTDNPAKLRETAELFAFCMRESHFIPGIGFSHRQDLPEVHSGWSGGFSAVEAGLSYGEIFNDRTLYRQAEEMAEFICRTGCSDQGYFNAEFRNGRWWPNVYWGKAKGLHIRHASEGCMFLGRILMRENAKGRRRPEWREAFFRNLEAVLRDQRPDGALPIEVHPKTGQALDWEGVTPGTWVGPLIIGSKLAEEDGDLERAGSYHSAALSAADYYLDEYIQNDQFFGGPYDAHRAPNMEDAYNLLNAFCELYRYTEDPRYLTGAKTCAKHLFCWRYVYDVVFPVGTICRDQRVSTYGMAPASVRNRHVQNWDTVAAVALHDLSRWTGDPFYARAALDNLNQSCQLVERGDGALGIPKGGQSEQWYATEFYWFGSFGHYGKGNLWKVSVVLPKTGFLSALALVPEWNGSV